MEKQKKIMIPVLNGLSFFNRKERKSLLWQYNEMQCDRLEFISEYISEVDKIKHKDCLQLDLIWNDYPELRRMIGEFDALEQVTKKIESTPDEVDMPMPGIN